MEVVQIFEIYPRASGIDGWRKNSVKKEAEGELPAVMETENFLGVSGSFRTQN